MERSNKLLMRKKNFDTMCVSVGGGEKFPCFAKLTERIATRRREMAKSFSFFWFSLTHAAHHRAISLTWKLHSNYIYWLPNEMWRMKFDSSFVFGAKAQRTFSFHSYLSCISARTSTNRGCCGTIWERREEQCHSERLNSLDERTMMIMFMLIDYLKLYFGIWSRTNGTKPVWRKVNNNERINLMK